MSGYYFDIGDLGGSRERMRMQNVWYERTLNARVDRLSQLCGRLPQERELFFIETQKSFSAFAFVAYVLRHAGRIDHLYIATYSTNERILRALLRWIDKGQIGTLHLHVSETLRFRMPALWQRLSRLADEGRLKLTTAWSHKKVACMDTPEGQFVVEGSGNYGDNSLQEQYVFLRSAEVCAFRMGSEEGKTEE